MSIKPDCDYLFETFDDRRAKRNAETQSLIDAKGMLEASDETQTENGPPGTDFAEAPASEQAEAALAEAAPAFVQVESHAPRMSFSGLSFLASA